MKQATASKRDKSADRRDSVLKIKVKGLGVRSGGISVPNLIGICAAAQNAIKTQAEALNIGAAILDECTLELIAGKNGSTTLLFGFAKRQSDRIGQSLAGRQAVSEVAGVIGSLGNGTRRQIDPAVLKSVYDLSAVAQSQGISELKWIVPQPGHKAVEATLDRNVREQAAKRLSAAPFREAQADGRDDFYSAQSLDRLAQMQNVRPITDVQALAGAIPDDTDVDSFLEAVYGSRK